MGEHDVETDLDPARLRRFSQQERGIGCLPVVEDGRLVGIVSERDFLNVALAALERPGVR